MFGRLLAGTLYIHFWGLLPRNRIFPSAKFTLCPSLVLSYIDIITDSTLVVGVSQTLRH